MPESSPADVAAVPFASAIFCWSRAAFALDCAALALLAAVLAIIASSFAACVMAFCVAPDMPSSDAAILTAFGVTESPKLKRNSAASPATGRVSYLVKASATCAQVRRSSSPKAIR